MVNLLGLDISECWMDISSCKLELSDSAPLPANLLQLTAMIAKIALGGSGQQNDTHDNSTSKQQLNKPQSLLPEQLHELFVPSNFSTAKEKYLCMFSNEVLLHERLDIISAVEDEAELGAWTAEYKHRMLCALQSLNDERHGVVVFDQDSLGQMMDLFFVWDALRGT